MKIRRRICFILVLLILSGCFGDRILAQEKESNSELNYYGTLEQSAVISRNYYLRKVSFDRNVSVKVTVELDEAAKRPDVGGHLQFAFTKDEAHSWWADDIALYPEVQSSYQEEFQLYAGTYTFEMHLIREEDTYIPFHVNMEITGIDTPLDLEDEPEIWTKDGWNERTVYKAKPNMVIDMYRHFMVSSWKTIHRTDITFQSSDKRIAAVNRNGIMIVKRSGTVEIKATLPNGNSAISKIQVKISKNI